MRAVLYQDVADQNNVCDILPMRHHPCVARGTDMGAPIITAGVLLIYVKYNALYINIRAIADKYTFKSTCKDCASPEQHFIVSPSPLYLYVYCVSEAVI